MKIATLLRAPWTAVEVASDALLWPIWVRLCGVRFGPGLRVAGRPVLRIGSGGVLVGGCRVSLVSRRFANPLVVSRPCAFTVSSGGTLEIGSECGFSGTVIVARERVSIANRVLVGANSTIVDTDFHPLAPAARRDHPTRGARTAPVVIEDDVFIGMGVIVLKGSHLGRGCVVGAGSVVSGTFPPGSIVAGNPARVVRALASGSLGEPVG